MPLVRSVCPQFVQYPMKVGVRPFLLLRKRELHAHAGSRIATFPPLSDGDNLTDCSIPFRSLVLLCF